MKRPVFTKVVTTRKGGKTVLSAYSHPMLNPRPSYLLFNNAPSIPIYFNTIKIWFCPFVF